MKSRIWIFSLIGILLFLSATGTAVYLYRENVDVKRMAEQKKQELEDFKVNEMKKQIEVLENKLQETEESEYKEKDVSDTPKTSTNNNVGERYCPALKECGNEYTDDYTCNNAVCCKVDGVTMLSFAPWACDDGYETVYLKSVNATYKCKTGVVDSVKSMDETVLSQIPDLERCLVSGGSDKECKKTIPSASTLDATLSSSCVKQ